MRKLLAKIRRILKDRRTRQLLTRTISLVAAIVVFVTTYALVLPAITMESEANCGIEAHQHDSSCYEDRLICGEEESPGHHHTDACYEVKKILVCSQDEHRHGEECYDEEGSLICGLPEHTHNDSCYEESRELVCGIPESDGHQHTDSCYEKVLICGKEVHTHSTACYSPAQNSASDWTVDSAAVAATDNTAAGITVETFLDDAETMDSDPSASSTYAAPSAADDIDDGSGDPKDAASASADGSGDGTDNGTNDGTDNQWSETADTSQTADANTDTADNAITDDSASDGSESSTTDPAAGLSAASTASTGDTVSTADTASASATASTASAASATTASASSTASTASTSTGAAAEDSYVPTLDPVNFNQILTDDTGIYYYHAENGDTVPETSGDITDWKPVENDTILDPADIIRVYLAYAIPAGTLNDTNSVARYRLPSNIHLSDKQVESINSTVNGIANQYVSMDTLEITDPEKYSQSLGVEAIEGTRNPSDDIEKYFKKHKELDGQEYISAVVRVEDVYDNEDEDKDKDREESTWAGTDLVFTFTPYSIQKNQHTYDKDGMPTSAGQMIQGWLTFDLRTNQIDFETVDTETMVTDEPENTDDDQKTDSSIDETANNDNGSTSDAATADKDRNNNIDTEEEEKTIRTTKEAEIVFVPETKDPQAGLDIDKISETLRMQEIETETGTSTTADGKAEKSENEADSDETANDKKTEEPSLFCPAQTFQDSITASMGTLSTDTENGESVSIPEQTELTVYVEADEGTFPEGTTMKLSTVEDMDAVASAVEGAVTSDDSVSNKTRGFHAVDISFWNKEGKEIEPLKPIRVSMKSESIKQAVEDNSTAPVVVHIEEPKTENENLYSPDADSNDDSVYDAIPDENKEENNKKNSASENSDNEHERTTDFTEPVVTIVETEEPTVSGTEEEGRTDTLTFEAGAFSVYAIVYTVDFHWEVDGKTYDFSIPGGGYVTLRQLVEVLGIANSDIYNEDALDDAGNSGDFFEDNDDYSVGEEPGVNEIDAYENSKDEYNSGEVQSINNSATYLDVQVSDKTREFVADVESVVFSNSDLVWVGKVDESSTIGGLKDANGLECQYSAELTEEQINEINAQTVESDDWALISVQPFTSEESLTVFMKNGDQFVVKVTDAQKTSTSELVSGDRYVIYIIKNNVYYALGRDGETHQVSGNDLDSLSTDYLWTYYNDENGTPQWASTAHWQNGDNYLDVYWSAENPDPDYPWVNKYYPLSPTSKGWQPIIRMTSNGNGGFYFRDLNDNNRYLANSNDNHIRTIEWNSFWYRWHTNPPSAESIYIYKQGSTYTVSAQANDNEYGQVKYIHNGSTVQTSGEDPVIEIRTNSTEESNKTVPDNIIAVPAEGYVFDGWTVLEEEWDTYQVTDWGQGFDESSLTIKPTVDGNLTLQANFRPERQYHFTVRVNDDSMGTVGYAEDEDNTVENLSSFESESKAVINNVSTNRYKITTSRKPMYKFLHWELRDANGQLVNSYNDPELDPGIVELTEDGMELVAVYARKKDNEIDNIDINDFLDEWQETMVSDFTGVDKTASVCDPANRIFKIDLTASSAKWEMERSLSLDFITDISRSMFFPANLEYAKDTLEASSTTKLKSWLEANGQAGDVYYVISDDDSATVFALFKDGSKWYYLDSSYYYYEESGIFTGNNGQAIPREVPDGLYFSQTGGTNAGQGRTMKGIVYVSADATDTYASHQGSSMGQIYWSRLDYLCKAVEVATTTLKAIDPNAEISLTTFHGKSKREGPLPDNSEGIYNILRNIAPAGGTRQDRGLLTSYNGIDYNGSSTNSSNATETGGTASPHGSAFSQGSNKKQVAILISDGAPNNPPNGWNDITREADKLKGLTDSSGEKLTLMTLGLSLNYVNQTCVDNFKGLATGGANGGYAINANSGAEIVEAIKTLIKNLVEKADLYGTATDTLDPAFYPVMADGTPIQENACFSTPQDVENCCDAAHYLGTMPPAEDIPYLQWTKNGDTWTVTYYNQTYEWAETDTNGNVITPGWKKSFYTKAKEDFLGGNTIETNGEASVSTDKCIVHGTTVPRALHESKEIPLESPHVNVKELSFVGNDTRWTVYIETEVTPIDQIKELYDNIKVLEVVSESTDCMITDKDAMLYEQRTGNLREGKTPETFYLKDIIPLTPEDWTSILENGYVDKAYSLYDHNTGNIRISLTKTGNYVDYDTHNTSSVVADKEEYVLTAQYLPHSVEIMIENDSDGGRYHTTKNESPGSEIKSGRPCNNAHLIDLYVRGLSITKTDEYFNKALPGAEFSLYHLATEEEIALEDGKLLEIEGDQYYPEELSFDDLGVAYKNGIRSTGSTTKYYLVETEAPDGYVKLEEPIPVELVLTNTYTLLPIPEEGDPVTQTTKPETGLYNWEEKATLALLGESGFIRTTGSYDPYDSSTDLTHTAIEPTSLYEVMYYRISNNPGAVLPNTGGPGTNLFYLIGCILTMLAGAGVVMKRRRREAA